MVMIKNQQSMQMIWMQMRLKFMNPAELQIKDTKITQKVQNHTYDENIFTKTQLITNIKISCGVRISRGHTNLILIFVINYVFVNMFSA